MDVSNEFTNDNHSIKRPINTYLKLNVFEHSAWFACCHKFSMSLNYKTLQNEFDAIFVLDSHVKCKLIYNKDIFHINSSNYEIRFILVCQSIFFNNFNVK